MQLWFRWVLWKYTGLRVKQSVWDRALGQSLGINVDVAVICREEPILIFRRGLWKYIIRHLPEDKDLGISLVPVTRPRWLPRKAGDLSCLTSSGFQQEANICSGKNVPRHPWTYHKWGVLHLDAIYLTLYAPCTPHPAYRRSQNKRELLPSSGSIILELSASLPPKVIKTENL